MCEKATQCTKLDKELATEIQMQIRKKPEKNERTGQTEINELEDETAGWHVIVGKSFASAITYQTTWVLFFDLLEGHHKSFLMFKTQ